MASRSRTTSRGAGKTNPGQFRDELTLKLANRVDDGAGGFTRSDNDPSTELNPADKVWANVSLYNGMMGSTAETYKEAQLQQRATHKVEIRYRSDVSQGDNFLFDGRQFYIMAVRDPTERKERLHLYAREGGAI